MPLTTDGLITVGTQTIGYTERQIYVYWDIAPDLRTETYGFCENPFYRLFDGRYVTHEHIAHIYNTRWLGLVYDGPPSTERKLFISYARCVYTDRNIYYYPDTSYRMAFVEGLFTNTPLLLKYPKYYNWNYIPQVINPQFRVWSFYPLQEEDINLKIVTNKNKTIIVNSGKNKDKVSIEKEGENIYKITFIVDEIFDPGEIVTCYLSIYDIKGNHLKEGLW